MDKVVLSLDGSEESRAAVQWCIDNLEPATKLIAVCGISEMQEFVLGVPPFESTAEQAIEEAFKTRWIEPLRRAGFDCEARVVHGGAAPALLGVIEREQPDALVVGKAPHSSLADTIVSGWLFRLVHQMPCPIVLVPDTVEQISHVWNRRADQLAADERGPSWVVTPMAKASSSRAGHGGPARV